MTSDPDEGQPTTTSDAEGLIAGRYRLISELGGGAMGVVWRARDEVLGRDVAVKQLRPDTGMSGAQVRQSHLRARREGRIAARLQHPNAVTIFDVAEHDGRPYLIMEYVPSSNLADILATGTLMTPDEVARIGTQLSSALAAAHAVGIVHRDIKPGNVLMTSDGTVKLTDFGISRATGDATVTATGEILGTPAYTAPEVAQGHAVDSPADVFSLGATLYAAVEGTPPFGDDVNAIAVLLRVVRNELRPPRRAGKLTDTVLRMLDPEPARRPTMKEVSQALAALGTPSSPVLEAPTRVDRPSAAAVTEALALEAMPVPLPTSVPLPLPEPEADVRPAAPVDPEVRPSAAAVTEALALEAMAVPLPTSVPLPEPEPEAEPRPEPVSEPAPEPAAAVESASEPPSPPESKPASDTKPGKKPDPKPKLKPTTAMPAAVPTTALPAASPTTAMPDTAAAVSRPESSATGALSSVGAGGVGSARGGTAIAPPGDPADPAASRRRLILAGGGVASAAVIVAAVVALSGGGGDKHPTTPAAQPATTSHTSAATTPSGATKPTTSAASSAASPPASSPSSASSSAASKPSSSPSSSPTTSASSSADIPTQLAAAITNYYTLVPGNLQTAWNLLTPGFQQSKALGWANYQSFWNGIERVTATEVQAKAPDTVVAKITYYPKNGQVSVERTTFTLVQDNGVWKIAHST